MKQSNDPVGEDAGPRNREDLIRVLLSPAERSRRPRVKVGIVRMQPAVKVRMVRK